jgi:uncharacterized membrane protein YfcA
MLPAVWPGVCSTAMLSSLPKRIVSPSCSCSSAGALAGMLGGRSLSRRLSDPHLQAAFAAVSAVVAVGMIAKALS